MASCQLEHLPNRAAKLSPVGKIARLGRRSKAAIERFLFLNQMVTRTLSLANEELAANRSVGWASFWGPHKSSKRGIGRKPQRRPDKGPARRQV